MAEAKDMPILSPFIYLADCPLERSSQTILMLTMNKSAYLSGHWMPLGYYSSCSFLFNRPKEKKKEKVSFQCAFFDLQKVQQLGKKKFIPWMSMHGSKC